MPTSLSLPRYLSLGCRLIQLIAWSEKTDETETLISLLDEVDEQLQIMEASALVGTRV